MLRQRIKVMISNIVDGVSEDFCFDNVCWGIKGVDAISWLYSFVHGPSRATFGDKLPHIPLVGAYAGSSAPTESSRLTKKGGCAQKG